MEEEILIENIPLDDGIQTNQEHASDANQTTKKPLMKDESVSTEDLPICEAQPEAMDVQSKDEHSSKEQSASKDASTLTAAKRTRAPRQKKKPRTVVRPTKFVPIAPAPPRLGALTLIASPLAGQPGTSTAELAIESSDIRTIKAYHCDYCNLKLYSKVDMIRHVRTHTSKKPFKCPHCDYSASKKWILNTHLKQKHQQDATLPPTSES